MAQWAPSTHRTKRGRTPCWRTTASARTTRWRPGSSPPLALPAAPPTRRTCRRTPFSRQTATRPTERSPRGALQTPAALRTPRPPITSLWRTRRSAWCACRSPSRPYSSPVATRWPAAAAAAACYAAPCAARTSSAGSASSWASSRSPPPHSPSSSFESVVFLKPPPPSTSTRKALHVPLPTLASSPPTVYYSAQPHLLLVGQHERAKFLKGACRRQGNAAAPAGEDKMGCSM
mmetsp:Transcript_35531/g.100581  ORF Transcript_35531/g.100581 Transcript_35531/m.100581 type:complete len:233 (+) Transcript_35531:1379-2077(+)